MVKLWYPLVGEDVKCVPQVIDPSRALDLDKLKATSLVECRKVDLENYETDGSMAKLKKEKKITHEDDLEISKAKMPNFEEKMQAFRTEHLHIDEEVRLCTSGSAVFEVRDVEDRWIRIELAPGDLIVLPAGIYHHLIYLPENYVSLKRYFSEQPGWKAFNRPADDQPARARYIQSLKAQG